MLNESDLQTLKYLRNSPRDALKKEAADLIERLSAELDLTKRKMSDASAYAPYHITYKV